MPNRGNFIGSQDNLFVPDAPTIGTATAGDAQVSVAFTAPSDVGGDAVTLYGASAFLAGATVNYKVSVATGTLSTGGSGNVYFIDGIPTKQLTLIKGFTYVFDLSDSSNSGHPFAFKDSGGSSYTSGVTTSGTAGNASATVTLVLATDASEPSSYYCTSHGNGMGNTISLIAPSASTDPLGAAQAGTTGSSSPITVTGLTNNTSYIVQVWAINDYGNGPLSAATASFSPTRPSIGLFAAGYSQTASAILKSIDKIIIETTGNATDFGDLTVVRYDLAGLGSSTRGVFAAGNLDYTNATNVMDYVTFASLGNATDFGDRTISYYNSTGLSNSTRGIFAGGHIGNTLYDVIDYITIASTGDATDFGNLSVARFGIGGAGSTTRGIFYSGGITNASTSGNTIDYVTIASTGNATDFGDSTSVNRLGGAVSSATRCCKLGGYIVSSYSNIIEYVTTASTGNGTDFGDLSVAKYIANSNASSKIRGVVAGGVDGSRVNTIEYITIASAGNGTDFGDCSGLISQQGGASNAHGGLA